MLADFLIGAVVATSALAPAPVRHRPDQQFTLIESGGGLGADVENTTSFSTIYRSGTTRWLVERNSNASNWCGRTGNHECIPTHTSSMDWIDGRTCASLAPVLAQLAKVQVEERGSAHPRVSDTPLLSLLTFKHGQLATERLSEYVGPLVDWWQSAQEQLKPCWTKVQPGDL